MSALNNNVNNVNTLNNNNLATKERVVGEEIIEQRVPIVAEEIVEQRAPIVREQHVYTESSAAPEIREKHVVREQHLTQEVPIIEKKVIHERPVVQEKTIVHEKPIVHEKKVVTNEQELVVEQPLIQRGADAVVREQPTIIRDDTIRDAGLVNNNNNLNNDLMINNTNNLQNTHLNTAAAAPVASSSTLNRDEKKIAKDEKKAEKHEEHASKPGFFGSLFGSKEPRPFATTTYDYGTAGSTTVAAQVPVSDLNTAATLPNGPVDNTLAARNVNNANIRSA